MPGEKPFIYGHMCSNTNKAQVIHLPALAMHETVRANVPHRSPSRSFAHHKKVNHAS